MAKLIVISAEGRQEVDLVARNSLGRHPNNTIQILDRIVSKEHCLILQEGSEFILKDLGSLNGTYVNAERVQGQKTLRDGDEITLGGTRLIFLDQTSVSGMLRRVTIAPGMMESHIRTKIAAQLEQTFMPEKLITDPDVLRRDYEKLRAVYELQRAIGLELDLDKLLTKILDRAFEMLPADRGVVLLLDDKGELKPRAVKTRRGKPDENIVLSTSIINEVLREKAAVLSSDASVDSRFHGAHSIIMQGIRSSMAVPILNKGDLLGIMLLDSQIAANAFTDKDLQLFTSIASQTGVFLHNSALAKKIESEALTREKFQRLLSPVLAEQVVNGKLEVKKGGQKMQATVLFADIRGFTSMSESRDAQDVVDMLNEYFELMVEIIFKHEGTLDKFIGDEIMVLYGAPLAHPDAALRAVRTAMEMQLALEEFNRTTIAEGNDPIRIGIGINFGEVVAGYMGSSRTMEYTAIGDTVNTASRLCSIARAGEVIVSEPTYLKVRDHFDAEILPPAKLKGKKDPLKIYRITAVRRQWGDEMTKPGS
ncbi:MAG: FHA domain-containing protein [Deltaproteobacteria bacterium]|nr:FHA domain-containing protein [Deltaproteobacteria bacterium]